MAQAVSVYGAWQFRVGAGNTMGKSIKQSSKSSRECKNGKRKQSSKLGRARESQWDLERLQD